MSLHLRMPRRGLSLSLLLAVMTFASTLVPVPVRQVFVAPANAAGWVQLHVAGGGGPVDVVLQAAVAHAGVPGGYALSNALRLQLLP